LRVTKVVTSERGHVTVITADKRGERRFTHGAWAKATWQPVMSHVDGHGLRGRAVDRPEDDASLALGIKRWASVNGGDGHSAFIRAYTALSVDQFHIALEDVPRVCRRIAEELASCHEPGDQDAARQVYFEDLVALCAEHVQLEGA
jgi:hypothetical protein